MTLFELWFSQGICPVVGLLSAYFYILKISYLTLWILFCFSLIHIHLSVLFQILSPFRLLLNVEHSLWIFFRSFTVFWSKKNSWFYVISIFFSLRVNVLYALWRHLCLPKSHEELELWSHNNGREEYVWYPGIPLSACWSPLTNDTCRYTSKAW